MGPDPGHLLILYRRHLIACGIPSETAVARTEIPGSRYDLLEYYTSVLNKTIECPEWAKPLPEEETVLS